MSARLLGEVFAARIGSGNRKMVLLKLADAAGEDDGSKIYPGVETIAKECELSERTVQRILAGFRAEGLLRVVAYEKGGSKHATWYQLNLEKLRSLPRTNPKKAEKDDTTVSPFSAEKDDTTVSPFPAAKGDNGDTKGCQPRHERVTSFGTRSLKIPYEPSEEERDSRRKASKATLLPDDWKPSLADINFAISEGYGRTDIDREADKFSDYWHSQPEAKARMRSWPGTWRNWIRRGKDRFNGRGRSPKPSLADVFREMADEHDEPTLDLAATEVSSS